MEFIHRQQATADETPPWAGIAFKLPIDSDMLAERLRFSYPQRRTLRERKHQATIDFFVEELNQMQRRDKSHSVITRPGEQPVSDALRNTTMPYNHPNSDPNLPRSASECTSPSIQGSVGSPRPSDFMAKPVVSLPSNPSVQSPTTPSSQFVWSAHDGRTARPKTKRKMTVEERNAYKATRKRGACSRCRKQKGKVHKLHQF